MAQNEKEERERLNLKMKDKRMVTSVGSKWVSRWEARRSPYHLSITDLRKIESAAVVGKKHGTPGIFYPIEDIRMLSGDAPWIPSSFVCESRITKQFKKNFYDIEELREEGVWGKIKGEPGKPHYHYREETLMNLLAINIVPINWVEGKDYVSVNRYPGEEDIARTEFAIHRAGRMRPASYFYWGRENVLLAKGDEGTSIVSRSKRQKNKELQPEPVMESDNDVDDQDRDKEILKNEILELRKNLAVKERKMRNWGRTPIYSSDSESD